MPPFFAAGFTSEVSCPVPLSTGCTGCPSARTPVWLGKMTETSSGSWFLSVTVTVAPSGTQSVGPGSWNIPLSPA